DAQAEPRGRPRIDTSREPGGSIREPSAYPCHRVGASESIGQALAMLPHVSQEAPDDQTDEHQDEQRETDPAGDGCHPLPGCSREVPEEDEPGSPQQTPSRV